MFRLLDSGRADGVRSVTTAESGRLPPSIMPVILLAGSDYEMGCQYGRQAGPWLEMRKNDSLYGWAGALSLFTREEVRQKLKASQFFIKKYVPEAVRFMQGIADGASEAGCRLTYSDVLLLNSDWRQPMIPGMKLPGSGERLGGCSNWAAWGDATRDGSLICLSTDDDRFTYQLTVMAYPETGAHYATTVKAGELARHLAINDSGLSVGLAAAPAERKQDTAPGLPVSIAVFRMLRDAAGAEDAENMLRKWEICAKRGQNFLLADTSGKAYAVEMTASLRASREPGDFDERDFIYQTNNFLSERLQPAARGTTFALSSRSRNRQIFHFLDTFHGDVDTAFAKMMLRVPGERVIGSPLSMRQVIGMPRKGPGGALLVCTGRAAPSPVASVEDNYLVEPTYSFYRMELAGSPQETVDRGIGDAYAALSRAYAPLRGLKIGDVAYAESNRIFSRAVREYYRALSWSDQGRVAGGRERLDLWAKALSASARSQALANQLHNHLVPPPMSPEALFSSGMVEEK